MLEPSRFRWTGFTSDMRVLGLETSCDETAAAIVDGERRILSNRVYSQIETHRPYGGVVPEIAARAHVERLDGLIAEALAEAGLTLGSLDGIAATAGPGLIGGVMVGLVTGKALAAASGRPLIAVNHLEGHALSPRLSDDVAFPYLLLLVSGGHCQLLLVRAVGAYRRLGTTIDDAVGEAFDKTARLIGLGYPGGPAVERAARQGDPRAVNLPRPMRGRPGCDFSFAGLKTAVRRAVEAGAGPDDIAASFQAAVADCLEERTGRALQQLAEEDQTPTALVVAGGVAANAVLRERLSRLAADRGLAFVAPPPALCTDNGAMIAWAGLERLKASPDGDGLDVPARARWPLDPEAVRPPYRSARA